MLTWHRERLLRAGPFCALAAFVLPCVMAGIIQVVSDRNGVFEIGLLASILILIGSLAGSVVTAGLGIALFSFGAYVAELPPAGLIIVACLLFLTLVLHDLAGMFHRAPMINPTMWTKSASMWAATSVASIAIFAIAYGAATLATWQTIVVPFGIVAIGFAAKLAADGHARATRQLTKKRRPEAELDGL